MAEKRINPDQIEFFGLDRAFAKVSEGQPLPPHLTYNAPNAHNGKIDGKTYYDLMGYNDDTENNFVLLKWIPEEEDDTPAEETDVTCDMAEYFPTFEAAFARLCELEGK